MRVLVFYLPANPQVFFAGFLPFVVAVSLLLFLEYSASFENTESNKEESRVPAGRQT